MRGFDHATILSPSFYGLRKERQAQWPAFCVLNYDQKFRGGGEIQKNWEEVCGTLPETLSLFRTKMVEIDALFQTKTAKKKKKTLWCGTDLYSLYKGLSPRGEKLFADYESRCLRKRD